MPAVMVEMGYLSNQEQETKMAGAEFQNLLVQAIYDAIVKFRDLPGRRHAVTSRRSDPRRRARSSRRIRVAVVRHPCRRRDRGDSTRPAAAGAPTAPRTPGRKIKAHLFYVADDGTRLTDLERDVPFGEGTVEQARQILEAQIAPAIEPLVSAVPPGTKLRTMFVTERGEAFVDFSNELVTRHSGGSTDEMLTVYTIVDVLTANLPAVTSVQTPGRRQADRNACRSRRPEPPARQESGVGTNDSHRLQHSAES